MAMEKRCYIFLTKVGGEGELDGGTRDLSRAEMTHVSRRYVGLCSLPLSNRLQPCFFVKETFAPKMTRNASFPLNSSMICIEIMQKHECNCKVYLSITAFTITLLSNSFSTIVCIYR